MDKKLAEYLSGAAQLYPHNLERQFPRVLGRIVAAWESPEDVSALLTELLIDRRGNRQGFPPEVAREIFQLSVFNENRSSTPSAPDDVWEHERAIAALEELGIKVRPAAMLRAAERGDTQQLALLVRAGLPVDARDARDWTPLMVAAFHGREAAAKFLIENGANPRARDADGYTPLHWAAVKGYQTVVAIIARQVDCNIQSTSGLTPLLQAAASGHAAVVKLLLASGADPNVRTHEGWTALHKAVANGYKEIVQLLLAHGHPPLRAIRTARHPFHLPVSANLSLCRSSGTGSKCRRFVVTGDPRTTHRTRQAERRCIVVFWGRSRRLLRSTGLRQHTQLTT